MLNKKYRGLSEADISAIFTGPHKTEVNRFFRINWVAITKTHPQFVVIVPPNVERSAVKRNRLRRKAYEMIRLRFEKWTHCLQIAILIKPPAAKLTSQQFKESFLALFTKIR